MRGFGSMISAALIAVASAGFAQNSFGQVQSQGGFGQSQGFGAPQPQFNQQPQGFGQQPQGFGQQPGGFQQPGLQGGQGAFGNGGQGGFAGQPGFTGQQPGGQPGFTGQPSGQPGFAGQPGGQQPGFTGQPGNGTGGQGQQQQMAAMFQQITQYEQQDFGVPASNQLHNGQMHGPTPASIPGGRLLTTQELVQLVQSGQPYLLFDVLGSGQSLPGAIPAVPASQPGDFNDQISQQLGQYLGQMTGGNRQAPMIFYCASVQCWMSYNAALRAINLGYQNVLWYRGGLETWQAIGGPVTGGGGGFGNQ